MNKASSWILTILCIVGLPVILVGVMVISFVSIVIEDIEDWMNK